MKIHSIAGLSLKGGRKDNFFCCLLEYYPQKKRWFLKSLLQVKDEGGGKESDQSELFGDTLLKEWAHRYELKGLVVDIPLTYPLAHESKVSRDSEYEEAYVFIRSEIDHILHTDQVRKKTDPKEYERERNRDDEIDVSKDVLLKAPDDHLLSRSFKRRLKKGFLSYWNRPLDFWVWKNYYDALLEIFSVSYDSYGQVSLMNLFRLQYLLDDFPANLKIYEGNTYLTMIELLRSKIISKRDLLALKDLESGSKSRFNIIKKIEASLDIFIYQKDVETLILNPRAFESFLLSVVGRNIEIGETKTMPPWCFPEKSHFSVPDFSSTRDHRKK